MEIDFTKEEYLALLDLLQVADWVLHANKVEEPKDTRKYRSLKQKVLALAQAFGADHLVDYSPSDGRYYPTRELEETGPAMEFIEDFEEGIFWSQLVEHLAERDLVREVGNEQWQSLDREERWERMEVLEERYWDEFERNGVERLEVVERPWYETPDMHTA